MTQYEVLSLFLRNPNDVFELVLDKYIIDETVAGQIEQALHLNTTVHMISMRGCTVERKSFKSLMHTISKKMTIKKLDVSGIQPHDSDTLAIIAACVRESQSIVSLVIGGIKMLNGASYIAEVLEENRVLTELDFDDSFISLDDLIVLRNALEHNPIIKIIKFNEEHFADGEEEIAAAAEIQRILGTQRRLPGTLTKPARDMFAHMFSALSGE